MASRLREKGFACMEAGELQRPELASLLHREDDFFDVVSCFNVLDRCAKPRSLLRQMKRCLHPNGKAYLPSFISSIIDMIDKGE